MQRVALGRDRVLVCELRVQQIAHRQNAKERGVACIDNGQVPARRRAHKRDTRVSAGLGSQTDELGGRSHDGRGRLRRRGRGEGANQVTLR